MLIDRQSYTANVEKTITFTKKRMGFFSVKFNCREFNSKNGRR